MRQQISRAVTADVIKVCVLWFTIGSLTTTAIFLFVMLLVVG